MKIQTNYQPGCDVWEPARTETYTIEGHTLTRMGGLRRIRGKKWNGTKLVGVESDNLEANIQPQDYPQPTHNNQPLIVALGMGTDSVAMLIEMKRRGIRPDIVQWADTGSERSHTYRYVAFIQHWLKDNDFPPLLIVRLRCPRAGHRSLFEQLWNTKQMPSPVFHKNHSCSAKWKVAVQRSYHKYLPWIETKENRTAIGFSADEPNRRIDGAAEAVGFSADEGDRRSYQMKDGDGYVTYYPLREWNITRADCVRIIEESGMPQPGKSACFFCPMSRLCEIRKMDKHQLESALALERVAREGGKLQKMTGLRKGSTQTWASWVQTDEDGREFTGLESDLA